MRIIDSIVPALLLATASVASADNLAASNDDSALFIERISGDKIETVYQEPMTSGDTMGARAWEWSGPNTLWVLRKQGNTRFAVAKIVDGKAEPSREVTLADFKLKREPVPIASKPAPFEQPNDGRIQPGLLATTTGQVWLARCIAYVKFGDCKQGFLRIDEAAPLATRPPANLIDPEAKLVAIEAPAGYSAALKTVKARGFTFRGAECKGPHGDWVSPVLYEVWPPDNANFVDKPRLAAMANVQVTKIAWVRAAPPVLQYIVKKQSQTWASYVEDCQDIRPAPILLEDGRWIDRELVRRADGSELGSLRGGSAVVVAPSARR